VSAREDQGAYVFLSGLNQAQPTSALGDELDFRPSSRGELGLTTDMGTRIVLGDERMICRELCLRIGLLHDEFRLIHTDHSGPRRWCPIGMDDVPFFRRVSFSPTRIRRTMHDLFAEEAARGKYQVCSTLELESGGCDEA